MGSDLIGQFLDADIIDSLGRFISNENSDVAAAVKVSSVLGANGDFSSLCDGNDELESKLLNSFKKNLSLLIQKTWVEKSDEELKEQVLYNLDQYCAAFTEKNYSEIYKQFFEILNTVVYLMFGSQSKDADFSEYTLRIDPEFGIFWWVVESLPDDATEKGWSDEKIRIALLLGMTFLANY